MAIQTVTLTATINVANYESLRIEVCADTAEEARAQLVEIAKTCGTTDATGDLIERYIRRVFGEV